MLVVMEIRGLFRVYGIEERIIIENRVLYFRVFVVIFRLSSYEG